MILVVSHRNKFKYGSDVSLARHLVHLTPRSTGTQTCHRHRLVVEPKPEIVSRRLDFFGNTVQFLTLETPHRRLTIKAESVVEVNAVAPPEPASTVPWEDVHEALRDDLSPDGLAAYEMTFESPYVVAGSAVSDYARASFLPGRPVLEAAIDLTARIHAEFRYDSGVTAIDTPVDEILANRHGVSRACAATASPGATSAATC